MQLTRSIFGQTARIALSQSCISKMGLKLHEFGNQQYGKGEIFYNMCMSVCGWYLKTQEAPLKKDLHIECVNKYYI